MSSLRILLVDDDVIERKYIQRMIGTAANKYSVKEAHSAEDALSLLTNVRFDVILMDYHLPGMDGIEATHFLTQKMDVQNAPVVILSNNDDQTLSERCINAGAQDFVLKSEITQDRILRAINQSFQRHAKERQLHSNYECVKERSERDELTGLHNRHFFNKHFVQRLQDPQLSPNHALAVYLLDLNKFKLVNDTLGHEVGDKLLIAVTKRFTGLFRGNELCARLGGDEFVFVVEHLPDVSVAERIAKRLCDTFERPFSIDGQEICSGCSLGVALAPLHSHDPETLLRCADIAMYQAKQSEEKSYMIFQSEHIEVLGTTPAPNLPLSNALTSMDQHLELMFYPVINNLADRIWGYRCKVHLRANPSPHSPEISPQEIREFAEQQNCIRPLGFWQLSNGLAELSHWQNSLNKPQQSDSSVCLSFEVTAKQLADPNLFAYVEWILQKYNVEPASVVFEMTENVLSDADEVIKECIETLANQGIKIAIIDFGVGCSSLTMLLKYPIHFIELAPVVIHQATIDISPYRKLLDHIQHFMNNLNISVAVRGIATEEELKLCNSLGFSLLQGAENLSAMTANEALNALNEPYTLTSKLTPVLPRLV